MQWIHQSPIPGHPMEADLDCSGLGFAARFAVAGDFDGDGQPELAVAPEATLSAGNDFWIMKYDPAAHAWTHLSPIPGHPMGADLDCSGLGFPARFALAADVDGDHRDELVIVPQAGGSAGNDFWVMKFDPTTRTWAHLSPIPGHPMGADIDCSGLGFPARFVVAGDFDGDTRPELAVAPEAPGSAGNDFWVLKFDLVARTWVHLSPIPGHPLQADLDCSGLGFPARFAVAADFDGDDRDELAVAPQATGSAGNDFWVLKFDPVARAWAHLSPIPGHPMQADLDCSGLGYPARFALAADFDGDQHDELVVAPQATASAGNDFWVLKFDSATRTWAHLSPIPGHPMEADLDCSGLGFAARLAVAGDFDGDGRPELAVVPDATRSAGNDLWVMKYDATTRIWSHLSPISGHPMEADVDCSALAYPARFVVAADFDHDQRTEIAVAPIAPGSAGNDFWVMKLASPSEIGQWDVLPIGSEVLAVHAALLRTGMVLYFGGSENVKDEHDAGDIDHSRIWNPNVGAAGQVSTVGSPARHDLFCCGHALLGDGRLLAAGGTDEWTGEVNPGDPHDHGKYKHFRGLRNASVYDPGAGALGAWSIVQPMLPERGSRHPMEADLDCSELGFAARFAVAGDFDGDGQPELAVASDATLSAGNDFWIMKYDPAARAWIHLSPIPGHPLEADLDGSGLGFPARFALAADVDGDDQDELVIVPQAGGSAGNDFWVLKFDPTTRTWAHLSPIPGHPMGADIDCSGLGFPARFVVAGDFDGDTRPELAVAPEAPGSAGNDLWVLKFDLVARTWVHLSPIPGHPLQADLDSSGLGSPARFAVAADFDGDNQDELAVAPQAAGSAGNDFWVLKFDPVARAWAHLSPIPGHPMQADVDCSGLGYPARFALAADVDGDQHAELIVVPQASGSSGNDFWVLKYDATARTWAHLSPIPGHPTGADVDCSGLGYPARFVVAADFDGDQHAEIAVAPEASGSAGNDFWVLKYDATARTWAHLSPIPGHPMGADIDCSTLGFAARFAIAADFDGDQRAEIAVAPQASGSAGNDFWVMTFDQPTRTWNHLSPILEGGGRWYPTLLTLADGSALAMSGHPLDSDTRHNNTTIETYDPIANLWNDRGEQGLVPGGYPRLHLLPNGRVFVLRMDDAQSWTWDPMAPPATSWAKVNAATPAKPGDEYESYDKTSVLLPLEPSAGYRPRVLALSSTQPKLIDLSSTSPSWQDTARRTLAGSPVRDKACAVLLPDATVLVTGGQQTVNMVTTNVVTAERFDPAANTWQTLADAKVPRAYHSVALLMPDGRVWTCGSDGGPGQHETRMELYSPPYLFRGARPGLSGVPASIQVGTAFNVATAQAAVIRSAALLRCSSSTHAFNPDQRYVGLTIAARAPAQLTLDAPPNHNIAPPGFYLLFLVDDAGVPSVGSIVRVD